MRLTSIESRWMELWFRSILPGPEDTFLPSTEHLPLASFIEDFFAHTPMGSSIGVRLASLVVTLLTLLRFGRSPRRLSIEKRCAWLETLSGSSIYIVRELPMLLKLTAFMAWDAHHEVHRSLGVTGPLGPPADWVIGGTR